MKKLLLFSLISICCFGCRSVEYLTYHQAAFFTDHIDISAPLEQRIQAAPAHVIAWLNAMDSTDKYYSYLLSDEEETLFGNYVSLLPKKYQQLINEKIIAVYFINNFAGGGMTAETYDSNGTMYCVWFYNPEILYRTVSDWINYRENSYFNDEPGVEIIVDCNSNYKALIHTLLHESSHVYDYFYHATPFVEPVLQNKDTLLQTNFTAAIWADYNLPIAAYDFHYRSDLHSYGLGPVQSKSLAPEIYRSLSTAPFASLYGSQNWAEDFAEAFTWLYINKYLNGNYRVNIISNSGAAENIFEFNPLQNPLFTDRWSCFIEILE